jgi:hypothetical protein
MGRRGRRQGGESRAVAAVAMWMAARSTTSSMDPNITL